MIARNTPARGRGDGQDPDAAVRVPRALLHGAMQRGPRSPGVAHRLVRGQGRRVDEGE